MIRISHIHTAGCCLKAELIFFGHPSNALECVNLIGILIDLKMVSMGSEPASVAPSYWRWELAGAGQSKYAWEVSTSGESSINEQRERRRLAENYAGLTDGELQRLAQNAGSLTDLAWEALEEEMERRHLKCPDDEADPREEIEIRELVTVRQFRDLPEALLAKGCLESVGIECFLGDENLVRLDWFISNFIGGIKLKVRIADAENASKILDEPILEGLYVQGVGLYEQPRCPKCQSLDVNFKELDRPIAYMSAFLRVPMPVHRRAWRCHSCDAEWEGDGERSGSSD